MENQPKFDFQNMDIKLYLALKRLLAAEPRGVEKALTDAANLAIQEFELSHGPLPDWAVGRNWGYELIPGAQLCTKDGRRTGNAHIIRHGEGIAAGPVHVPTFECLTDAGHKILHTEKEIESEFYIGDWISDPKEVVKKFDRQGHFKDL
jgi:hypothetical protein